MARPSLPEPSCPLLYPVLDTDRLGDLLSILELESEYEMAAFQAEYGKSREEFISDHETLVVARAQAWWLALSRLEKAGWLQAYVNQTKARLASYQEMLDQNDRLEREETQRGQ